MRYPYRHGSYNDYSMYNDMSVEDLRKTAKALAVRIVRTRRNQLFSVLSKSDIKIRVDLILRPRWMAVRRMIAYKLSV